MATLKLQSSGTLYSNTVISALDVDEWAVCYIWYSEEGPVQDPARPVPARPVPSSLYQM